MQNFSGLSGLGDGTNRIFLNTKGTNDDEVPKELVDFLHYVEDTTDGQAARSGSERIRRIHERVRQVRASEEIGVKYMQAWEERYYDREEAREEGWADGRADGLKEGLKEGQKEGQRTKLTEIIAKRVKKGETAETIADYLEEDPALVREIIQSLYESI